jgi:hypothetical protein
MDKQSYDTSVQLLSPITNSAAIEPAGAPVCGGAANMARPRSWVPNDASQGKEDLLLINPGSLYTDPPPEFYLEMRRRVDAWFKQRNLPKSAPPSQIIKGPCCPCA